MRLITRGAVAGLAGTAVMSMVMLAEKMAGMEPGNLEPKEVTENVEEAIGVRSHLPESMFEASWMMMHLGYGSTSGVAYALAQKRFDLDRPVRTGPSFGISLWALGYCGWLPLSGLYPPPTRLPGRKVGANILAHIAYGTVTAMVYRTLRARS